MSTHPHENHHKAPHGASDQGAGEKKRRRGRGRGRKPSQAAAHSRQAGAASAATTVDLDDDSDDDLALPSYGMKFDRQLQAAAAAITPKPARPAAKPPAAERPPAKPQAAARKPQRPPRPQAAPPAKRPAVPPKQHAERAHAHAAPESTAPAPTHQKHAKPRAEKPRTHKMHAEHKRPPAEKTREKPPREAPPPSAPQGKPPREVTAERARPAAPRAKKSHSAEFAALGLSQVMLDALAEACYETPTPVQGGFIPRALAGVDVMGQAQTGTGKTAAFAIPILEMLQPHQRGAPPQALALVPTRELAVQVRDECEKLALGRHHAIVAVYGGKPIRKQIEQVAAGASVIVGTPGRVLDLMSRGALTWTGLRVVVLDEADRMLDIGFRPDIEKILRRCPQGRQTLLLSATLAPPVKRLAERYMREPEVLDFSPKNLAVETIEQFYFTVDPERKFDLLLKLLEREDPKQAIVFCRTKRGTDKVYTKLARHFQHVDTIHGDLQQSSRDRVMRGFRDGKIRWLVATDVVGRGIDVSGISHIINFDIPQFCDDYVHRVGRTGRMGREGVAYTFVTPEEGGELTRIEIRINRLLNRDEIPGFQAFGDPRPAEGVVLGEGPGYTEDDYVESPKPAPLPVFGKPVRRVRRAL
jgi:ATP-dependent RNA helicase DeaD